jgi:hypothetical protein
MSGASLNFRFYDLLPLPHLLVVFTSVSSSFSCIGLSLVVSVYLLVVSVYILVVASYRLSFSVSVYDIDVFAHNINLLLLLLLLFKFILREVP